MMSLFCAVLSLILAGLEWLGSPTAVTPPNGDRPQQSQARDTSTSGATSRVPLAPGSEQTASVFALLRAVDPCGLHDVAAAARVTGDQAEAILPGETLSTCQLRMRNRPHEPTWTFTTSVGITYTAADRLAAVPEEIDGRTVYRAEVISPPRSCVYTRPMGSEFGISVTVQAPLGEPNTQPCPVAKAYLMAAQPLTRLALRAQKRTEPRLPLASIDPCRATNAVLDRLGVAGTAEPTTPYACRIHPDGRGTIGAAGSAVSISYGFTTDPSELAGAGGRHQPVTLAGRPGVATSSSDGGCQLVIPYDTTIAIQIDRTRWLQTVAIHTNSCEQARTVADTVLTTILPS
jgi:hypothetical protein